MLAIVFGDEATPAGYKRALFHQTLGSERTDWVYRVGMMLYIMLSITPQCRSEGNWSFLVLIGNSSICVDIELDFEHYFFT